MTRHALNLLAAAALLAVAATSAGAAKPVQPTKKRGAHVPAKSTAVAAVTTLLIDKNPAAVARYWSADYIQHSPVQPAGREPIAKWAATLPGNEKFKYEIDRVLADGDLVAFHGRAEGFQEKPVVIFNVFRVKDGKLFEHWEGVQPEAGPNPSGRTMLDGEREVRDVARTGANRELVREFLETVLVKGQFDKVTQYVSTGTYLQHNPNAADGLDGLSHALEAMAKAGMTMKFAKVHRLIADGNFVLAHSEGELGGRASQFFDLFRVDAGKIVEHWDVIQDVSGGSKNGNGIF